MRIVVDTALNTGPAEYANLGDIAMLQVSVKRLRDLWPAASIDVLTESPSKLALFCPEANPLPRAGRDIWVGDNGLVGAFRRLLPQASERGVNRFARTLRLRYPKAFLRLMSLRLSVRDRANVRRSMVTFIEAMQQADLLVVCGAGGFTDSSRAWTISTLNTMEEAIRRKVPVAMFGQGMGPLSDADVQSRARKVLPDLDLVSLREGRIAPTVAQSLGVSPSRIMVTGDEATELAYAAKSRAAGDAVGVNIRVASYAKVDLDVIDRLRPILHNFARRQNALLLPIPIAFHAGANDRLSIQELLKGFDDHSDGGAAFDIPLKVIEQIGRCRVVVSGAYHAAVFALAQGIPVIGLAASEDYAVKFAGLEKQFGSGCQSVRLDYPNLREKLEAALAFLWDSAQELREPLLEAARKQIRLSQGAYDRLREIVNSAAAPIGRTLEKQPAQAGK